MSRVTSISENEMNIQISPCNVRHVNGMLNIFSGNLSEKDTLTEKKIQNTSRETIVILEILYLML